MKSDDQAWMEKAIHMAETGGKLGEVPIGAVIINAERLISSAYNRPIQTHDPSEHAEVSAIRQAARQLKNYRLPECTLYVTLEPCLMCWGAIIQARISKVVFGAYDLKLGVTSLSLTETYAQKLNHKTSWIGGIEEKRCQKLLTDFFQSKR